jgi:hypothetical protein
LAESGDIPASSVRILLPDMHGNTLALLGMAGTVVALWAAFTVTAFVWLATMDPLWMATTIARVLAGLW